MSLWTNVQPHLNVVVMCSPLQVMCSTVMPVNLWCAVFRQTGQQIRILPEPDPPRKFNQPD